mmetsp:Transcript_13448/g.19663  ORF Transcript_13448/g.19663 Transcript_13448/m.19663 type:complete len:638 (+) Transcript_13448:212-2125(+)
MGRWSQALSIVLQALLSSSPTAAFILSNPSFTGIVPSHPSFSCQHHSTSGRHRRSGSTCLFVITRPTDYFDVEILANREEEDNDTTSRATLLSTLDTMDNGIKKDVKDAIVVEANLKQEAFDEKYFGRRLGQGFGSYLVYFCNEALEDLEREEENVARENLDPSIFSEGNNPMNDGMNGFRPPPKYAVSQWDADFVRRSHAQQVKEDIWTSTASSQPNNNGNERRRYQPSKEHVYSRQSENKGSFDDFGADCSPFHTKFGTSRTNTKSTKTSSHYTKTHQSNAHESANHRWNMPPEYDEDVTNEYATNAHATNEYATHEQNKKDDYQWLHPPTVQYEDDKYDEDWWKSFIHSAEVQQDSYVEKDDKTYHHVAPSLEIYEEEEKEVVNRKVETERVTIHSHDDSNNNNEEFDYSVEKEMMKNFVPQQQHHQEQDRFIHEPEYVSAHDNKKPLEEKRQKKKVNPVKMDELDSFDSSYFSDLLQQAIKENFSEEEVVIDEKEEVSSSASATAEVASIPTTPNASSTSATAEVASIPTTPNTSSPPPTPSQPTGKKYSPYPKSNIYAEFDCIESQPFPTEAELLFAQQAKQQMESEEEQEEQEQQQPDMSKIDDTKADEESVGRDYVLFRDYFQSGFTIHP